MPERLIRYDRLNTPADSGATLIEPAHVDLSALAAQAADVRVSAPMLDTTIAALRDELRAVLGLSGPVIATGHQAEFSHAGVFAKRIACGALAARLGCAGVYVMVDSDTPKSLRVALPPEPGQSEQRFVAIPGLDANRAMAFQPPVSAKDWRAFFENLATAHNYRQPAPADNTLLTRYSDVWLAQGDPIQACDGFEAADAAIEDAMGMRPLKVIRVSALSGARAFRAFVASWLLSAEKLAEIYNDAQRDYRRRHRVRTAQRPVPPLQRVDDRIETPFWIKRAGAARRRLLIAQAGADIVLFADAERIGVVAIDTLRRADRHDQPWPIENDGWLLRPRALSLSAFMRLFLSDLFIHGIGGAKYDEVTEQFTERGFGVALPPLACVTATLRLAAPPARIIELRAARRAVRDARYNPQRYIENPDPGRLASEDAETARLLDERAAAIEAHRAALAANAPDRAQRRAAFDRIHAANAALLAAHPGLIDSLQARADAIQAQQRQAAALADREVFFALHRAPALQALADDLRRQCASPHAHTHASQ